MGRLFLSTEGVADLTLTARAPAWNVLCAAVAGHRTSTKKTRHVSPAKGIRSVRGVDGDRNSTGG
jgi:hypothetical protein